jgi:Outer membrane protein beta-barrel domain
MRKNIFLLFAIALIVNYASAQRTRFGITAGPVASTMFQKVSKVKSTADYRIGETAGILLDVPMLKGGSFQPGVNFVTKGMRGDVVQGTQVGRLKTNLNYLEVTLNVIFRIRDNNNNNVILGGGAVPSLPLSGKRITEVGNVQGKESLEFGDKTTDDFNGTDFGANALVGYELANGFFGTLNYYYGFNRQFVGGDPKDKLYQRYFALRIGYFIPFSKKK